MKKNGVLYWITGLSGAGKSTIGNRLYHEIKKQQDNVVFLDGDILKKITSTNEPGYTREERKARAMQYAYLCKSLTDQGLVVICCTIAMFDEVRSWNRNNNKGYVEVFINTPMSVLVKRNQKGLYSGYEAGTLNNVAGKDIDIEIPDNPDIEIINDDSNDIDSSVLTILNYDFEMTQDFQRDTNYWDECYRNVSFTTNPSKFALYVQTQLIRGKQLLECGCGNGRDSLFFQEKGLQVTAIDASKIAIDGLNKYVKDNRLSHIWFACDDFVSSSIIKTGQFDYVYSRFSLHAINEKQELDFLHNVKKTLKNDGLFFIEARSINDPLFGKGRKVGKNAYIHDNHYRRFIDLLELRNTLIHLGYNIILAEEKTGYAPHGYEDPPIIRVVCGIQK